jgi:hypothetical protein
MEHINSHARKSGTSHRHVYTQIDILWARPEHTYFLVSKFAMLRNTFLQFPSTAAIQILLSCSPRTEHVHVAAIQICSPRTKRVNVTAIQILLSCSPRTERVHVAAIQIMLSCSTRTERVHVAAIQILLSCSPHTEHVHVAAQH